MMKTLLGTTAIALGFAGAANAAPAFCTGTTTVVASGSFVAGSTLVGTGNCVEASDKIFGGFTVGGAITAGGTAGWLFTTSTGPADVTIGFQGLVGSNLTGNVDYLVEIDPLKSNGALISALEKDFTFNSTGAGSTATLTGTVSPTPDIGAFSCTRTLPDSTCPETGNFSPLTADLSVNQTITTGPNTNVTAITDTIFQKLPISVPEPSSLTLLATSLALVGFIGWRRNHSPRA